MEGSSWSRRSLHCLQHHSDSYKCPNSELPPSQILCRSIFKALFFEIWFLPCFELLVCSIPLSVGAALSLKCVFLGPHVCRDSAGGQGAAQADFVENVIVRMVCDLSIDSTTPVNFLGSFSVACKFFLCMVLCFLLLLFKLPMP